MVAKTRIGTLGIGMAAAATTAWLFHDVPSQLGKRPLSTERASRIQDSPQFVDGAFTNPMPASLPFSRPPLRVVKEMMADRSGRLPTGEVPLVTPSFETVQSLDIGAVWFGHSSAFLRIEGHNVLIDPVWSYRVSPSRLLGPRRIHETPVPLDALPDIDAVVISHDHYDHLDRATTLALARRTETQFVVPLGVGAHLQRWGIPLDRIIELDWNEEGRVGDLTFVATAARHFSGRSLTRNDTLWASWVISGSAHRAFYAGDSGYFDGYAAIGEHHGPFDVTFMPVGAYDDSWPDIHMTPEQAVSAHVKLRGKLLVPVHWGTYTLARHSWSEPIERLWQESKERGVSFVTPRPGDIVNPYSPATVNTWWQALGAA